MNCRWETVKIDVPACHGSKAGWIADEQEHDLGDEQNCWLCSVGKFPSGLILVAYIFYYNSKTCSFVERILLTKGCSLVMLILS
jgi:hypothetical protein